MALNNVDAILNGLQPPVRFSKNATPNLVAGRPHSLFYLGGYPGAAVAPTPGIAGVALTSYAGQLPFSNPASGVTRLARFQGGATQAGLLQICDRLYHNSGVDVTLTTEQTFTASPQIPARDGNGTNAGFQVEAAVEVYTATGAGTPTLTLKYTNSAGTAGQIGTNIISTVASSAIGAFYPIGLAAGDTGIQKAQSLTLSATWTSGTIGLVLYRVLCSLELTTANIPNAVDELTSGFPQMFDNTVPFLVFIPQTTTASNIVGQAVWAQG